MITKGEWWASGLEVGTAPQMVVKIAKVSGIDHREALRNAKAIAELPDMLALMYRMATDYEMKRFMVERGGMKAEYEKLEGFVKDHLL